MTPNDSLQQTFIAASPLCPLLSSSVMFRGQMLPYFRLSLTILLFATAFPSSCLGDGDSFRSCEKDADCSAYPDGSCKGCWNHSVVTKLVEGMCRIRMFCICQQSSCSYPSREWLLSHGKDAAQRCFSDHVWTADCINNVAYVLRDRDVCEFHLKTPSSVRINDIDIPLKGRKKANAAEAARCREVMSQLVDSGASAEAQLNGSKVFWFLQDIFKDYKTKPENITNGATGTANP